MKNWVKIQSKINYLLSVHPSIVDYQQRKSLFLQMGLPKEVFEQIDFSGSSLDFLSKFLDLLNNYCRFTKETISISNFFEVVKRIVGVRNKKLLEEIKTEWYEHIKGEAYWSVEIDSYLKHLVRNWEIVQSPLLPPEYLFSETAVDLNVIFTGRKVGDSFTDKCSKNGTSTIENELMLHDLLLSPKRSNQHILFGNPGSGKTTLLKKTAAELAKKALQSSECSIPVFVPLASFANKIANNQVVDVFYFMELVGKSQFIDGLGSILLLLAKMGKLIFLLDGLDEISDSFKGDLINAIDRLHQLNKCNKIAITSRYVGFSGFYGFSILEMAPLRINHQRQLMLSLCGKKKTQRLLMEISGKKELFDFAKAPMMLIVLLLVARESKSINVDYYRRHSEILKLATKVLLEGRHRNQKGVKDPYNAELIMAKISIFLHINSEADFENEIFTKDVVLDIITKIDNKLLESWQNPVDFIKDISGISNIIHPIDTLEQKYRYLHRIFREYFTALEISKWEVQKRKVFVSNVLFSQQWAEILVILGGLISDVNEYLLILLSGPPNLTLRTLNEIRFVDPSISLKILLTQPESIISRKETYIKIAKKSATEVKLTDVIWKYLKTVKEQILRIDLYFIQEVLVNCASIRSKELLNELFNYLPDVPDNLFEDLFVGRKSFSYWCDVEEGKCLIGANEQDPNKPDWVIKQTEIYISQFKIGRVPITNSIYELFDPFHKYQRQFQHLIPAKELDQHPVVGISWYEAEMFCQWASQAYPNLRLPTEFEWEKAASWDRNKKLLFPWGNEWDPTKLNSWMNGPNRTTSVGSYLDGSSPCGALDMAGNVWEWCLDWFIEDRKEYELLLTKEKSNPIGLIRGKRRVDRGGGWYHDVGIPHTYIRAADLPSDIFHHCGFRIIQSEVNHKRGSDLFPNPLNLNKSFPILKQIVSIINKLGIVKNKILHV